MTASNSQLTNHRSSQVVPHRALARLAESAAATGASGLLVLAAAGSQAFNTYLANKRQQDTQAVHAGSISSMTQRMQSMTAEAAPEQDRSSAPRG